MLSNIFFIVVIYPYRIDSIESRYIYMYMYILNSCYDEDDIYRKTYVVVVIFNIYILYMYTVKAVPNITLGTLFRISHWEHCSLNSMEQTSLHKSAPRT